jgi:DNA-binding response OmpR family regulator
LSRDGPPKHPVTRRGRPVTVLVVDDDEAVLSMARQLLETFRISVLTARSTAEALQVVASGRVDLALIDWRLTGHDDGIALGRSLRRDHRIPFIVFSGYLSTEVTGNAYKQGAADVIDKPLRPGRLLAAVDLALSRRRHVPENPVDQDSVQYGTDSVSRTWATLVLKACRAAKDPRTESAVASSVGLSLSVFRRICSDGCEVGALETRDLVRFLRALSRAQEVGSTLRSHLAPMDRRTREKLFERAGLPVNSRFVPLRNFLLNQHFIPANKECLRELAHLAANDPLFFIEPDELGTGTQRS